MFYCCQNAWRVAAVACLLAGTGCAADIGATAECQVTLGGAISGSVDCTSPTSSWTAQSNQGLVKIVVSGARSIDLTLTFTGEPQHKLYAITDSATSGGITVSDGTNAWAAGVLTKGTNGVPAVTKGSLTMTFTSVEVLTTDTSRKTYSVHGALDATLAPNAGTTGEVSLHLRF